MSTLETSGRVPIESSAPPHAENSCPSANGSPGAAASAHPEPGLAEPSPNGAAKPEADHVQRAEEMVDRVADRVAGITSTCGRWVVRLFSRVKEEASDIWSEAQSIRRGDQP